MNDAESLHFLGCLFLCTASGLVSCGFVALCIAGLCRLLGV